MTRLRLLLIDLHLRLERTPRLFYIGGSDVLPPPLEKSEEEAAIAALTAGSGEARRSSSSTICASWSTSPGGSRTQAWAWRT